MIEEYGYTAKPLLLYIDQLKTFEALGDISFVIKELYDYANMMKTISPKFDKYPRHFLTTHQIACRNYSRMKKEFPEELFKKRINKQYECSFGDYIFIYPESTQDIKDEATMQNNCVASYIDKVIDGKCHILFLRKKNKPNESLVTIEVRNNHIVQARRRFNSGFKQPSSLIENLPSATASLINFDNIGEICEVTDIQEGGIICFKFGGCYLGCMSYDEYEKHFEKVETPVKRTWSKWNLTHELTFIDIKGDKKTIKYQYRNNGKRIQVRSGALKAGSSCYDEDEFSLSSGLELAEMRLVVKYLDNQVKSIAKAM